MRRFTSDFAQSIPHDVGVRYFTHLTRSLYASGSRFHNPLLDEDLEQEFKRKLDPVREEFAAHKACNHSFFDYLKEQSKVGFTPEQYAIYRANFFHRTQLTAPSVAKLAAEAALLEDHETAAFAAKNLSDETGNGDPTKTHGGLLLRSHNTHGLRVFSLDPIKSLADSADSPLLVPAVKDYRRAKIHALSDRTSYAYKAGNTWAHEFAADGMLNNFNAAFFDPYKSHYTEAEYKRMIEFFTAHNDPTKEDGDIEAQHERMHREIAERACKDSIKNIEEVRRGGLDFLNHQAQLWTAMEEKIKAAYRENEVIPLSPPNRTISPTDAAAASTTKHTSHSHTF